MELERGEPALLPLAVLIEWNGHPQDWLTAQVSMSGSSSVAWRCASMRTDAKAVMAGSVYGDVPIGVAVAVGVGSSILSAKRVFLLLGF